MRTLLLLLLAFPLAGVAASQDSHGTILHLLDYIAVDYAGAVADGKVKDADEYKEMLQFSAQVVERVRTLPQNPAKAALVSGAANLAALVQHKRAEAEVAEASTKLRWVLIEGYGLKLAPRAPPDPGLGSKLYAQHCASCHGVQGRGDGPAAKALEPAPADFHDLARMGQRSPYGLYNTITLGVAGTSMAPFKSLSESERWALAFHVSGIGLPAAPVADGERRWKGGEARDFASLENVATLSTNEVQARFGADAAQVHQYLRAHPEALKRSPLAFAREKVAEAAKLYRSGERQAARDAAIRGYLEGFELVEASLSNVDPALMRDIEREMMELRDAIERRAPAEAVAQRAERMNALLAAAGERLGSGALSPGTAFTTSLLILLREGLEAILVLAAITAFVLKTGRRDALAWLHAGWMAALVAGALTWAAATFLFEMSGASRELTEGVTALIAAATLLYVGYWLHSKSHADAWNRFIRETVGQALARRTRWAVAAVAFLAVYREVFEVVLFYQALWAQAGAGGHAAVVAGAGVAAASLGVVAFAILRYSVRLPIGPFFKATSALLALFAAVFAGHGVAALQEAGAIPVTAVGFDPLPLLGIYPSAEALGAQILALLLVALGFWSSRLRA